MRRSIVWFSLAVIGCVMLWHCLGTASGFVRILISTPLDVARYAAVNHKQLLLATVVTSAQSILGLLLATVAAMLMATLALRFPVLRRPFSWSAVAVQVVPLLVFAPFLVIALGAGMASKVVLVALICSPPILDGVLSGVDGVSRSTNDLLEVYGAAISFKIAYIWIPLSLPSAFVGFRIAASLSVVGSVVAEFSGATVGIGRNLLEATMRINPELLVLSLMISCMMGLVLYGGARLLERWVCWWR
jgi:ABC-type nitrate/sulfonate/bicarbonate transport system permease component